MFVYKLTIKLAEHVFSKLVLSHLTIIYLLDRELTSNARLNREDHLNKATLSIH